MTVRFDARASALSSAPRRWRARLAALLAGCCVASLPVASLPTAWRNAEPPAPDRPKRTVQVAAADLAVPALGTSPVKPPNAALPAPGAPPAAPVRQPIAPPEAAPAELAPSSDIPAISVPPSRPSLRVVNLPGPPPPPARLRESDRAVLLAEAPTRLTLRIGTSALGKVDFRMTDTRTIDVQLSGLLDLLAGHYDAAEFSRLRSSAAADAYISFDQLRALGLNVHYDPAYDELRING